MKVSLKHRLFSTLLFLLLAVAINLVILAIMLLTWYPNGLHNTIDIYLPLLNNFLLIGLLGGILGFVVTKQDKVTQRKDFLILGILQALFSIYPIYQLWQVRPAYIVYDVIDFFIIKQNELVLKDNTLPVQWSYFHPTIVGISPASTPEEKSLRIYQQYTSGIFNAQRTELYTPFDSRYTTLLDKIVSNTLNQRKQLNDCQKNISNAENLIFFIATSLVSAKSGTFYVALDKANGQYMVKQILYCPKSS